MTGLNFMILRVFIILQIAIVHVDYLLAVAPRDFSSKKKMGKRVIFSRGDYSWEGGSNLPQNNFIPSLGLCKAILYSRTMSVQRFSRSSVTDRHIDNHTEKTSCYFFIRI